MKILNIRIKNYRQFKDTFIDLTDNDQKSLSKICFIGSNGTGKSTVLKLINAIIRRISGSQDGLIDEIDGSVSVRIQHNNLEFYYFHYVGYDFFFEDNIKNFKNDWVEYFMELELPNSLQTIQNNQFIIKRSDLIEKIKFTNNSKDLLIFSPSESTNNSYLNIVDVPTTTLNQALPLFKEYPFNHIVSNENVELFWTHLIYLIKKREEERERYETDEKNINKTKKELIEEFDRLNPKILNKLSEVWNKILAKADLIFDSEKVNNPYQLSDNLYAYIFSKTSKQVVDYNQLSTGIRNFIFRIGHMYSLFFNREIEKGVVLIDEPENSLFPDFLYDLIGIYSEIFRDKNNELNTQFYVATHSPIIAAQFKPYERIILEWDSTGHVIAQKGKAPEGDDPNDLLLNDFGLTHVMGEKGEEMWMEYKELKKKLRHETDSTQKDILTGKISEIGRLYNF